MSEEQHDKLPGQARARNATSYPVTNFKLENHPLDDVRALKVAVVGAGLSGILAGILLPVKVPEIKLTIFEKNCDVVSPYHTLPNRDIRESNLSVRVVRGSKTPTPGLDAIYRPMSIKVHLHPVPNGRNSSPKAPRSEITGRTWLGSMGSIVILNWATALKVPIGMTLNPYGY